MGHDGEPVLQERGPQPGVDYGLYVDWFPPILQDLKNPSERTLPSTVRFYRDVRDFIHDNPLRFTTVRKEAPRLPYVGFTVIAVQLHFRVIAWRGKTFVQMDLYGIYEVHGVSGCSLAPST